MTLLTKTRKINTFRKYNTTKKVLKTFSNIKNFIKIYLKQKKIPYNFIN